jgi:hypothetical protein
MTENEALERYATDLKALEYVVITHPKDDHLPAFAKGLNADLVATKGAEGILLQVKGSRDALEKDPNTPRIAAAVESQPGWRFDLIVLQPESESQKLPGHAREPSLDQIVAGLAYAERVANGGDALPGFVLAWGTLEATMRHAARQAGLEVRNPTPTTLIRVLYSNGLIDQEEFGHLNEAITIRNASVHGLHMGPVKPDSMKHVIDIARRLVSPSPTGKTA